MDGTPGELIRLQDLAKIYGGGTAAVSALRGVTLHLREGEFVAIMGPTDRSRQRPAGGGEPPTHAQGRLAALRCAGPEVIAIGGGASESFQGEMPHKAG
ncbi:hypothetical protein [Aurantimonas sp. VKM B-3413]|uniref:hypothetical protein n=1 Tax=Aurantimonas sp. VKM B-3413 TaxID=2779401 RepID=UPI001E4972F1|nr:hypothetical protein [Aurantimonas sp. VKM B-3413]MCB8840167.1 hypothetical protein [Aurantimonas sp. VKM B-3413]